MILPLVSELPATFYFVAAAALGLYEGCYTVVNGFCTCMDFNSRVILGDDGRRFVSAAILALACMSV